MNYSTVFNDTQNEYSILLDYYSEVSANTNSDFRGAFADFQHAVVFCTCDCRIIGIFESFVLNKQTKNRTASTTIKIRDMPRSSSLVFSNRKIETIESFVRRLKNVPSRNQNFENRQANGCGSPISRRNSL